MLKNLLILKQYNVFHINLHELKGYFIKLLPRAIETNGKLEIRNHEHLL